MGELALRDYQKHAISELCNGKKFLIAGTGIGKTACMLHWLKSTGKPKCAIITTAAKRDAHDIEPEADEWFGPEWRESLSSFSVVGWRMLRKWTAEHINEIDQWAIAFDEIHNAKAGISSDQGTAFLKIAKHTDCWTGYTATPAENWLGYYPYFTACGHVRNKTDFERQFCIIETFRGFKDYVGWRNEKQLEDWWEQDSFAPDTTELERELPAETHKHVYFKKPTSYDKVDKTGYDLDGNFIETNSAMRHYLRRMCASKAKLDWLKSFVEGLQDSCVIFYNYIAEGDDLEAMLSKIKSVGKVWRIDGRNHDIPNKDTIGKKDVVLAQWMSGSNSLNLQFLNYWVSMTPHDSYTTTLQAKGRIKRMGQTKPMFFYYLRCDGTEEDNIYENLEGKKDFSDKAWVIKRKEEGKYLPEKG